MKTNQTIIIILLLLVLSKLFSLLIYPIPIEVTSNRLNKYLNFIFPIALGTFSLIIIIKKEKKDSLIKYFLIFIGFTGLLFSFVVMIWMSFWDGSSYNDKEVIYQSVDNQNDRIIKQFKDEGALGSNWREVRVKELCCGFRYSNRFCKTTLNGNWLKYNSENNFIDTCYFDNYIYKSEINKRQNWMNKKCK